MKKLFLGTALLSAVLSLHAQTVDEIATRHTEALGGKANLDKVQSVVMEGTMDAMGNAVNVKVIRVQGKLYRQDISIPTMSMTGYNLVTDTSGWMYMPFIGQTAPEPLPAEALKDAKSELNITDGLVDYQTKGNKIEMKGKEDVAGTDCYKLEVTSASGDVSTVYVDMKTYLISRISTTKKVMGNDMAINMDYSDYKDVDGIKFPFTLGTQQGPITFTSIKLNQTIEPTSYSH